MWWTTNRFIYKEIRVS